MKFLLALVMIFVIKTAEACSSAVLEWGPKDALPEIAFVGVVTEEQGDGLWSRIIRIEPKIALRGVAGESVTVPTPCGQGSPALGERAYVARFGAKGWMLIPAPYEGEFIDFLLGLSGKKYQN